MNSRFQAKRPDGRSEWQVIFDIVRDATPGQIFSYDEFAKALNTDSKSRIYQAVIRCNRELWRSYNRSLRNIRRIGYKVLLPQEHEEQALDYQSSARRKVSKSVAVIQATDLTALSDNERDRTLRISALLVAMGRSIDWHTERLARHDELIGNLAARIKKLEHSNP